MLKSYCKSLLAVVLLLCVALLYSNSRNSPQLTLNYLGRTNDRTQTIVQFGITNVGNAAAVAYLAGRTPAGRIQLSRQRQEMGAYCYPTLRRLSPGQGDVIQVILPKGLQGRWRFTCNYARDGTKLRIDDWKWEAESFTKSFRARASRLIPSFATKVRCDVAATSDWIAE
jgi:hypothetical protein